MSVDIAQIMSKLIEALNAHDLDRVATFYAPDFIGEDIGQANPQHGPRERVSVLAVYIRAFPDLRYTGETIAEDNRAAFVWTMHGTHRGTLMRIPPTGRTVEVRGVSLLTFNDGKITHGLNIWDMAGLLRVLGLLPEL
jgi:steroid delta-isomerase-like uncharacterized protein